MKTIGTVLLCCVIAAILPLTSGKVIERKTQKTVLQLHSGCDIDELSEQGYIIHSCIDEDLDPIYVKHGGVCKVVDMDPSVTFEKHCFDGSWISPGTSIGGPNVRKKRWGWVAVAIACALWCGGGGGGGSQVITKTPPKFPANCTPSNLMSEYIAEPGTESTSVSWFVPTASDDDGDVQSVQQVFGGSNGGTFEGSPSGKQHAIGYEAIDNDGLKATCYFTFNVKVETCSALLWPPNGYRDCPNDNILGASCNYGCNTGYQLTPSVSTVTCESKASSREWTTIPTCEKVTCGNPPEVTDGTLTCNDAGHTFSSYCKVACSNGFELSGQVFTNCKDDGTWFWLTPSTCTDDEKPQLSCITPQLFYADKGSLSASVYWEEPTATDNLNSDITILKTDGPDMGVSVAAGTSTYVRYKAIDEAGNESPECNIELRALAISCGHPLDTFEDNDLLFNCTLSSYTYGDACTLDCERNLPLEGTDLITCEQNTTVTGEPKGYWNWGSGEKPYCRDIACPDLEPPRNGALVFDTTNNIPSNYMLCNDQFDIPTQGTSFNGVFICRDNGTWVPNLQKAPECVEPFFSRGMQLPSEVWYYSGTCGVDDNILEQFEQIVSELHEVFQALCPTSVSCTVVNPSITCGEISKKKRRSTDSNGAFPGRMRKNGRELQVENKLHSVEKREADEVIIATFYIQTDLDYDGLSSKETYETFDYWQLDILKPAVLEMINAGGFNIPSPSPLELRNDSFRTAPYGDFYCDAGSVRAGNTKTCKPCSLGRYEVNGVCTLCPLGEYSDTSGSAACTKCPDGYSTRHDASESADNCTKQCSPGSYSPDTFVPCAECRIGFYQSQSGQKICNTCPIGKTTTKTGTTTQTDCEYFDVILDITDGDVQAADIALLHNISMTFWMKTVSAGLTHAMISIGGVVDFWLADTITIDVKSDNPKYYDLGPSSHDAWVFVAMTWDTTNSILSGYYNGDNVFHQQSVSSVSNPVVQDDHLVVTASTAVMLSGLSLRDTVINEADVNEAASSCQADNNGVVTMEHFKNISEQGISLLTPSVCDAIDDCANETCGPHRCTNEIEGFTCTCSNGWSGITCNTPPDFCINNDCTDSSVACVSGTTNYTCQCMLGYSGVFCEIPPVNGGWSTWSSWSECTMTCNSGTHQRTRACDSPAPTDHGQTCGGDNVDIQPCNTSPCKECPELTRGFGNQLICTTTNGLETCTVTCRDGYLLPSGLQTENVTCGFDTNYEWLPFDNVPDCTEAGAPGRYTLSVSGSYNTQILSSDVQAVEDGVAANALNTDCYNALTCTTTVGISDSSRRKRSPGSTVTLSFTISLTDTSDLQLADFTANGTVSTALQEIIDAINNLEGTSRAINSSASSIFDVTVNGAIYTIDASTVTFDGTTYCPSGQVVTEALCVECPIGTYKNGDFCSYCEKGTYQSQTGQSSCTPCLSGFSTVTIGSDSSSDCTVPDNTTTASTSTILTSTTTATVASTPANSSVVVTSTASVLTSDTSTTSTPTTKTTTKSAALTSTTSAVSKGSSATSTIKFFNTTENGYYGENDSDTTVTYIAVTIAVVSLVILVVTIVAICFKKHHSHAKVSDSNVDLNRSSYGHPPPKVPPFGFQTPCKTQFRREHSNAISLRDFDIEEINMPPEDAPPICRGTPSHSSPQYYMYSSLYDP